MDKQFAERLLRITRACRDDMHEPDEQDLTAVVTGLNFDNAMGDDPFTNCQEMTVGISEDFGDMKVTEWFNLASLIALARIGAKEILD